MKSLALRILVLLAVSCPTWAGTPGLRFVTFVRPGDSPTLLATLTKFRLSNNVILFDTPSMRAANERFIEAWQPFHCNTNDQVAEAPSSPIEPIVVCSDRSRRLQVAAAGLAMAARAPLLLIRDGEDAKGFANRVAKVKAKFVLTVGDGVRETKNEMEALSASIQYQSAIAPIDTLVLVNPTDPLADLAPLALRGRNAVLLMTNDLGDNGGEVVRQALTRPELKTVEHLLILGSPHAIATERRANPHEGKDDYIEMDPGTPRGHEPYTLSIGRLFHSDPGFVALTLARAGLLPADGSPRTALVASNPGGSLPMLETFSRTSARELAGCGYQTTSLIGDQLSPSQLRRRLPDADVFLWEGHHNTLIKDWGFTTWSEPLKPSFHLLQSCLALTQEKTAPLIERGALAVVGSSTRIYSATGGAFSLAYLDAMLYERQTLGGSLRSAKNFLLAFGQLKQKRLENVKFNGANERSAWAFTLWGDPAIRLPSPTASEMEPRVRTDVAGDTITLTVPSVSGPSNGAGVYQAVYRPNSRLAGLVRTGGDGEKKLVPLAFAEVSLPHAPANQQPRLRTKVADNNWVFLWDARRRVGWLLAALPATSERTMRFHVEWHNE